VPVREDVHSRRFYVIVVHVIMKKEVSTLTPRMDLSLRTRVYVRGSRWVGHLFEFQPVRSDTSLQIPIKRSLDLFRPMWWISYLGFQYSMWHVSYLLGSDVSRNLLKDSEDPGGACLSPLYTSDWLFWRSVPLSNNWITMAYDREREHTGGRRRGQ
jgi:hypothetical protein